jgi:hypothetical protein
MSRKLKLADESSRLHVTNLRDSKILSDIKFPKYDINYLWRDEELYECKNFFTDSKPGDIPAWSFDSIMMVKTNHCNLFKPYISLCDHYDELIIDIYNGIIKQMEDAGEFDEFKSIGMHVPYIDYFLEDEFAECDETIGESEF